MTKKIILFNGPKATGKDFAINHLLSQGLDLERAECKTKLFGLTISFFRLGSDRFWEIYNNRSIKELPLKDFSVNLSIENFNNLKEVLGGKFSDKANMIYSPADGKVKLNLSAREALIYTSECLVKPTFGEEYFGECRVDQMESSWNHLFVDSSCGFIDELKPLIERVGQDNILLLRIHRDGCTFEGDSRMYIPDGVIDNTVDIENNGSLEEYYEIVENSVRRFIKGQPQT